MKFLRILTIATAMLLCTAAQAQDKAVMGRHQQQLSALLNRVASAPTDNERYLASEEAVQVLAKALEEDESERWKWSLPTVASVLTSPDGLLRVFSWAVVRDDGEFECFGAVQFYNDKEEEYQYSLLHDYGVDPKLTLHDVCLHYADGEEARLLETEEGTPLVCLHEVVYDQRGRPLHNSVQLIRGDRFVFRI